MPHITPGTILLNRYQIVRLIGHGGMGAVYETIDQRLGHRVALKQLLLSDPLADRAFAREAKLLAGLRHAALASVSDYFVDDSGQFLVMQYIPGANLAEMLVRQSAPFPVEQVLSWADQLLNVLEYLHRQQSPILHRDIKPQNIKLAGDNEIVLIDFGLARGAVRLQSRITTGGSILGYTPQYAPLEQIQGQDTDPRSDLYALSATLYHLLTNTIPLSAIDRAAAFVNSKPDPLPQPITLNPNIPADLNAALLQALSLGADQRPPSAAAFRAMLKEAAPISTASKGSSRSASSTPLPLSDPNISTVTAVSPDQILTAAHIVEPTIQHAPTVEVAPSALPPKRSSARARWAWGAALGIVLVIALGIRFSAAGTRSALPTTQPVSPTQTVPGVAVATLQPTTSLSATMVELPTRPAATPTATQASTETPQVTTPSITPATSTPSSVSPTHRALAITAKPSASARPAQAPTTPPAPTDTPVPTESQLARMPSFKGWNFNDAVGRLMNDFGIQRTQIVLVKQKHSELKDIFADYLPNEVIRTLPAEGQSIEPGSTVTIYYRDENDDLKPSKPYPAP